MGNRITGFTNTLSTLCYIILFTRYCLYDQRKSRETLKWVKKCYCRRF